METAEALILEHIAGYVSFTPQEGRQMLADLQYAKFPRGTVLLRAGQIARYCYFNVEGLIRQYELVDGRDKTTYFYAEGDAVVAFDSGGLGRPSNFSWVCEEDCLLVLGPLENWDRQVKLNAKLEEMSLRYIQRSFGAYQNLIGELITIKPENRYLRLRERRPELINRVAQYHLASFLGVTPETLSRIRRRLVD